MRYLTLDEALNIILQSGGSFGIRDLHALESALANPELRLAPHTYIQQLPKSLALGFSLIQTHPFVDGNKRVGHAAMEVFLVTLTRFNRTKISHRSEMAK